MHFLIAVFFAPLRYLHSSPYTILHSPSYAHAQLAQVQSRFNAQPAAIKARVEALIERDYMERDPDNRNIYKYVA